MMNVEILKGDITRIAVDAIVNASNTSLLGGGKNGVNGAIFEAGGEAIEEACKQVRIQIGECAPGQAVITHSGNLPSKYVIHTVGPVWKDGKQQEEDVLAKAYLNSLKLAEENKLKSIAFPNISTGIYGFPKRKAAQIAIETVRAYLAANKHNITVVFVCHNEENYELYQEMTATAV